MPEGATAAPVTRERGWRLLVAGLVLFLFVPATPLRIVVPVEQTIILVVPVIAALAVLAWRNGGRAWLALTWLAISAWMLSRPALGEGGYDLLARGWAVLLAAIFGLFTLASVGRPFFSRALAAVTLTLTVASTIVLFSTVSPARVPRVLADELDRRVTAIDARVAEQTQTPEWQDLVAQYPQFGQMMNEGLRRYREVPPQVLPLFPALLALESLAALGLAWSLFHRFSRTRVGPPLRPLREFRFSDQLVWGLLAGIVILLVPTLGALRALGANLLVFFGGLYAIRGLGVLAWFMANRRLAQVALAVLAVLTFPFSPLLSLTISVGVGLGDTWIDWRSRARPIS